MQVIAALGRNRVWEFAGQAENDRDIMGRKRPENIFLPANFTEIQATRVDITNPAKIAVVD
jgi:hypothetical protein